MGQPMEIATNKDTVSEVDEFTRQAVSKFNEKRFAEAIVLFDKAISLNPGDGNLYNLRAHAKYSLGDLRGAKGDFNRSKRLKNKTKKSKSRKKSR